MSRYDSYGQAALKVLATAQEVVRLEGRSLCTAEDVLAGFVDSGHELFLQVYSRNGLTVDAGRLTAIRDKIAALRAAVQQGDVPADKIRLSDATRTILDAAEQAAAQQGASVDMPHLLRAAWQHMSKELLELAGSPAISGELDLPPYAPAPGKGSNSDPVRDSQESPLTMFGRELTGEEPKHPIVGRDREIDEVINVLLKFFKPNPLLLGEAGVGKTAIVEGLAQRIRSGAVPPALRGKRIIELRISDLFAGTSLHGAFEERMRRLIAELEASPDIILFLDEIHQLVPEGRDRAAAEILKPALARGTFRCIGATTLADYYRSFQKDSALARRFHEVRVTEPSPADTLFILNNSFSRLEKHFGLTIPAACLGNTVRLCQELLPHRRFPDKAFDVLDQACSLAAAKGLAELSTSQVEEVAARMSGLAWSGVDGGLEGILEKLEENLSRKVIGQPDAVRAVANTVRLCKRKLDLRPERPDGVFLFVGPTGVGKTAMAQALAEALTGDPANLLRIDLSEFSEAHSIARLIGAPAGYVGYGDEPQLLKYLRRQPSGVLLLDEMDKAHPQVLQCFLQVFDTGRLTDARGDTHTLTSMTIVATANLVSGPDRRGIGFDSTPEKVQTNTLPMGQILQLFPTELVNRFDEIVEFLPLTREQAEQILDKCILQQANARIAGDHGFSLLLTDALKQKILNDRFSKQLGVRQLQRTFENVVLDALASSYQELRKSLDSRADKILQADWREEKLVWGCG